MPHANDVFALLENRCAGLNERETLLFTKPVEEIICRRSEDLAESFDRIDRCRINGLYPCGYVSYETGYFLADKRNFTFADGDSSKFPFLHFFVFKELHRLSQVETDEFVIGLDPEHAPAAVHELRLSMTKDDYLNRIEKIRNYIRDGDTYQVNFTIKYFFKYEGSAIALYRKLRTRQKVEFGAFLNLPNRKILSLSPELFIRKKGQILSSKPMKGTAKRGHDGSEDLDIIEQLRRDPKTLSENVMIVDLIRNDIGRIAETGSVRVENLFEIQTFETLHQMVSTVHGKVDENISIGEVFRNLFPCGSITGAPKLRTMEIIEEIETDSRGVYTGAIGYVTPQNDFCFNVPIRTCVVSEDGAGEMGIGGGILYEADAEAEFEECMLKAKFLTHANSDFMLTETMGWDETRRGIPLLERHLARLDRSARFFHFRFDRDAIVDRIHKVTASFKNGRYCLRLFLDQYGETRINVESIQEDPAALAKRWVEVSAVRVNSKSCFLYHSTTERKLYTEEYKKHTNLGSYDVMFLNEDGYVTEASLHNVFVERNGTLYTSPTENGLLNGIQRQLLIEKSGARCILKPLTPRDLLEADRLFLTSSVRGVIPVELSADGLSRLRELTGGVESRCYA